MQRPKAQMLEKTGAILRLPAASARALGALKRLALRRPWIPAVPRCKRDGRSGDGKTNPGNSTRWPVMLDWHARS